MSNSSPTVLVIFGVTGDLSTRKLLPSILNLAKAGELPADLYVLGITRQSGISAASVLNKLKDAQYLQNRLEVFAMDTDLESDYRQLSSKLTEIENKHSSPTQKLFYLSVPPKVSQTVIHNLGISGLSKAGLVKILLEKPFGTDLDTASSQLSQTSQYFNPDQVYRIDHFLAKETVQNLIVFRLRNSIFKHTWSRKFIERIDIIAAEKIDIEGRTAFYEQTGALRDVVQSHLLQLAALTLMNITSSLEVKDVPAKRLSALKALRPVLDKVIRGQYIGYREDVGIPGSAVETFVSITLASTNPRWLGVPITIVTGKALDSKKTEIRITYRQQDVREANLLVFKLQPDEGIELSLWAKQPGFADKLEAHKLHFNFAEHYELLPDAYERVLSDAIKSDHSLFASGDEVLESWRILSPVLSQWQNRSNDLVFYQKGSTPNQVSALSSQ